MGLDTGPEKKAKKEGEVFTAGIGDNRRITDPETNEVTSERDLEERNKGRMDDPTWRYEQQ